MFAKTRLTSLSAKEEDQCGPATKKICRGICASGAVGHVVAPFQIIIIITIIRSDVVAVVSSTACCIMMFPPKSLCRVPFSYLVTVVAPSFGTSLEFVPHSLHHSFHPLLSSLSTNIPHQSIRDIRRIASRRARCRQVPIRSDTVHTRVVLPRRFVVLGHIRSTTPIHKVF